MEARLSSVGIARDDEDAHNSHAMHTLGNTHTLSQSLPLQWRPSSYRVGDPASH